MTRGSSFEVCFISLQNEKMVEMGKMVKE